MILTFIDDVEFFELQRNVALDLVDVVRLHLQEGA
jgi:hypothetical protein